MRLHKELNNAEQGIELDNKITDECNKDSTLNTYMENFTKKNISIISDYFFGTYYTSTTCMSCGYNIYKPKTYTYQKFNLEEVRTFKSESCQRNLNLLYMNNVPNFNIINIADCLYYDRQGKPYPNSNIPICKRCAVIRNINFLTIIYSLPKILIFIFNKVNLIPNVKVFIEQQINIDFFADYKPNKIYDLIGIIFNYPQNNYSAFC